MRATTIFTGMVASIALAGCAGSHGGPNGSDYVAASNSQNIPAPSGGAFVATPSGPVVQQGTAQGLEIQIVNRTSATIDFVASTPPGEDSSADSSLTDLGTLAPGQTTDSFLGGIPSTVTITAGVVGPFAGSASLPSLQLSLGTDYSPSTSVLTLVWQDGTAIAVTSDPTLPDTGTTTLLITNNALVPIDVVATTPDQTVDLGSWPSTFGGQSSITTKIDELPTTMTLSATAQATDGSGNTPTFADILVDLSAAPSGPSRALVVTSFQ